MNSWKRKKSSYEKQTKECGQDPSSPGLEKDRKILAKYFRESNQRRSFGERIVIIPHKDKPQDKSKRKNTMKTEETKQGVDQRGELYKKRINVVMLRMKNQQNDSSYSDKTGMFSPPPQSLMLATGTETLGSSPRPQMSCHQHTNLLSDKCLEYNHGNGLSYSSSNLLITNKFKNTHNNRKKRHTISTAEATRSISID